MKKLFTLMVAAATLILTSCTAEDAEPIQNITPIEQEMTYRIVEQNLNNMVISRYRDSVWTSDPQWVTDMKVPVLDKDVIKVSSNGEVTTEVKQLYVTIEFTGENPAGFYSTGLGVIVGEELYFYDTIGKPW